MTCGAYINDEGDFEVDDDGHLVIENSIETRCRIRLMTRRGEWLDPEIGSRLHEIRLLKNVDRKIKDAIREALQPLIDSGEIDEIRIGDVVTDSIAGLAAVAIEIVVSGDEAVNLGLIPFGGA